MSAIQTQQLVDSLPMAAAFVSENGSLLASNSDFKKITGNQISVIEIAETLSLNGSRFCVLPQSGPSGEAAGYLAIAVTKEGEADSQVIPDETSKFSFRDLVDASPAMIWITDANSQCVYLSQRWYEYTGRTPEEDLGLGWLENIHPDDLPETARVYAHAVANLGTLRVDYRLRNKRGEYHWAIDLGYPRFDEAGKFIGYIGTVTDVHDKIAAENELKQTLRRFDRSAGATDLGIWYCDLPFDELIWNDQVKNHFWLPPNAHVTIGTFYERIHPDDREPTRLAIEQSNLKKAEYDIVYRTTNPADVSQIKFIRAVGWTDFDNQGRPKRFDGLTLDITADRQFQAELERAKNLAETANIAKSEFLANMSHEIRTPLGAILGFTELMRDPAMSRRERENYIETITRNGKALTRIIDDILDLAKVESGKLHVEEIEVSLTEILDETVDLLREKAKEKGIFLIHDQTENAPDHLRSDPTRLRQILLNLIGNAVKFTQTGGVRIRVSREKQTEDFMTVAVTVEDTGIGIELAKREKLFRPFAQADSSTTRQYGGTGLGLALSARLATALGGGITIEDSSLEINGQRTNGTAFKFSFKTKLSHRSAPVPLSNALATPQPTQDTPASPNLAGLKILLADDSADNRMLFNRILMKQGAQTSLVSNGKEALDLALSSDFDVVLMDVQMPIMDGYEATRALRASNYQRPIVALTAHAMADDRNRSQAAGCDAHITKPVDAKELVTLIADLAAAQARKLSKS